MNRLCYVNLNTHIASLSTNSKSTHHSLYSLHTNHPKPPRKVPDAENALHQKIPSSRTQKRNNIAPLKNFIFIHDSEKVHRLGGESAKL